MSDPNVDRDPFEVVAESFLARYRAGERPGVEEYAALHPELADQIRELLPALLVVEQDLSIDDDSYLTRARPARALSPSQDRRLGDYRIVREIGRGGMGVVYEAEQVSLGRRVALKVLPRAVASDREGLERFRHEAKAAARLHHTNIVPVFEVGCDSDVAYYAMQFIQGQALDQVIDELSRLRDPELKRKAASGPASTVSAAPAQERRPAIGRVTESFRCGRFANEPAMPSHDMKPAATERFARETNDPVDFVLAGPDPRGPRRSTAKGSSAVLPGGSPVSTSHSSAHRSLYFRSVAQIGRQAAQGLAYAHASGIVHRDIKPSNLLLDHAGIVWITDFGLAKGEDDGLTHTGDILGTIRYMAPERFRGDADARADVYALGLTLYELLTLRPAFDAADRLELMAQIKAEEPKKPRIADATIPRDLETIVLKAVEKAPEARYQSAHEMGEDLRRFIADEPIQARQISAAGRYWRWSRRNPAIAALCGVLSAVLLAVTIGSLLVARRHSKLADVERASRLEADLAREKADTANALAEAEAYRAMFSEVKALRVGRQPGWRELALANLTRLSVMQTPRRDQVELRTEAAASLGTPDIRLAARIEFPSNHLRSTAFSHDGRVLVSASINDGLDFWDARGRRHLFSARGLTVSEGSNPGELGFAFHRALYLAHDHGLAVATQDDGVVFADARGIRTSKAPITRGASRPMRMASDALGRRIAVSWTDEGGITVHDTESGTLLQRFDGGNRSPFALSPDGGWLACHELDEVVVYPIALRGPKVVLGRQKDARDLAFSPDGALLAVASYDRTTTIWDVVGRKQYSALRGHRERVVAAAFSPDGEWIATTSGDYTTRIWEARTGQTIATLPGAGDMDEVIWSPDGHSIAATTNWNRSIFLYEIEGRHDVQQWLSGPGDELVSVVSNPHLEQFTTSGGGLLTWDVSGPRPTRRRLTKKPDGGHVLAISPDGTMLATASELGAKARTILVRDATSSECRYQFACSDAPATIAFDQSGRRLAYGGFSGTLVVWDLATNRALRQFETGFTIRSIAFLDSDRRLVTHGNESVFIYDLEAGHVERRVTLPGGIRRFVVDRHRRRLILAFESGAIESISLPELTNVHRLENAHHGPVKCLDLSPDGRLVATGGEDHRVVLRDPMTFQPLLYFPDWTRTLRDLAFDCVSRRLAVVGTDSDLELWNIAALEAGLAKVGLAWNQPTRAPAPGEGPNSHRSRAAPEVVVIRP
jgi:eukaryotic-like serine/threonine-protein kinase